MGCNSYFLSSPGESRGNDMRGTCGLGVTLPCGSICQAFLLLGAVIGFSSKNKKKVEGEEGESEHNKGKGAFRKRCSAQQRAEQRVCLSKVCLASTLSASYLKHRSQFCFAAAAVLIQKN